LYGVAWIKTWMAGTSPAMTVSVVAQASRIHPLEHQRGVGAAEAERI
ncbi:MAG: hypothetical protein JWP51_3685, partial [Bradyrhizobium sp.]|nr:hypothetical protein [Bradyrhizobium sp.]